MWKVCSMYGNKQNHQGMSLLEVLLALTMTAVIVGTVLSFYIRQYQLTQDVMTDAELEFSLLRAGQVLSSAVASAESVEWSGKRLKVTSQRDGLTTIDTFYLADKDYDGIMDLYRERLKVPNPIASRLILFECSQTQPGLWLIQLEAGQGERNLQWERKVRMRLGN